MLRAALTSRSWRRAAAARPLPHVQRHPVAGRPRTPSTSSTTGTSGRPRPGRGRTTGTCTPACARSSRQAASEMARARQWLPSMLRTCRSSITTAWFSRTSRVVSLCRWSRRRSVIRACTRATLPAGLGPVRRPALLAGQLPLRPGQPDPVAALVARVGDLLPGRQGDQRRDPGVDTDHGVGRRAAWTVDLAQQRHVPAPGRVPGHGHRAGLGPVGQRPRPEDVQRLGHLRQRQRAVAEAERRAGVLRRRPRRRLRLERRVPGPLVPEVRERALQVPQRLLQRHRGHLGRGTPARGRASTR